mmetsp:Transcript_45525/g.89716  ORF Transcript_45525/g.89716 Transcript_45525/m.89716 type:complete len:247 (-) Transcript_45525:555-1295(-)
MIFAVLNGQGGEAVARTVVTATTTTIATTAAITKKKRCVGVKEVPRSQHIVFRRPSSAACCWPHEHRSEGWSGGGRVRDRPRPRGRVEQEERGGHGEQRPRRGAPTYHQIRSHAHGAVFRTLGWGLPPACQLPPPPSLRRRGRRRDIRRRRKIDAACTAVAAIVVIVVAAVDEIWQKLELINIVEIGKWSRAVASAASTSTNSTKILSAKSTEQKKRLPESGKRVPTSRPGTTPFEQKLCRPPSAV